VEQEAAELFPGARILVLSSDLVDTMERLGRTRRRGQGRFDIVIGTRLSPSHHF